MPVKKRNDRYQVDINWKKERIRRSFDSQKDALEWEAAARAKLAKGLPLDEAVAPTDGPTLEQLLETVRARYWAGKANENDSVRNAEAVINVLGPTRHPKSVTAADLDDVIAKFRAKGNSDATVNRKLAAFGKMMTHALTRGIIDRKPHVDKPKEAQGRLRWYTPEEETEILAAIDRFKMADFKDLVVFLLDTGCRLGEACDLEARHVSETHVVFEKTKNNRRRAVPITSRVRAILGRRRKGLKPTGRIFEDWNTHKADNAWDRVRAAVGLSDDPEAVLHAMRHTCASRLVQAGVPLQVVQEWLGHRTINMTSRYAHLAPTNLLQAVTALEKPVTIQTDIIRSSSVTGETPSPVTTVTKGEGLRLRESAFAG